MHRLPRSSCRRWQQTALIVLLFAAGATAASGEDAPTWTFEQLADGVYAALQPAAGRFDDSNSVVVVGDDGVLVVDAQSDAEAVRALIRQIGRWTPMPVRLVVNTHWHSDHTQGNQVYREAFGNRVLFIGHASLTEDVPGRAATYVEERVARLDQVLPQAEEQLASGLKQDGEPMTAAEKEQQRAAIERAEKWLLKNRGARFLPPSLTYETRLTLHLGERRLELHHLEGHTRGDTVVFLPREKILLAGDLLDDLPYAGHGYPRQWISSLRTLGELDFETVVPGHGPIYRGRGQLDRVRSFFEALVAQVEATAEDGKSLEETREAVDAATLRQGLAGDDVAAGRFFDAVLGEAVERAYLEARGELPD